MLLKFISLLLIIASLQASVNSQQTEEATEDSYTTTPQVHFIYKVKALNTALFYVLDGLKEDIKNGEEVNISPIYRIRILMLKIKAFGGEIEETNLSLLNEIQPSLPQYLVEDMKNAGISLDTEFLSLKESTLFPDNVSFQ
ncbi:uncharacterized protein LOC118193667 [Stegodyphus dumicola]|uniref:uncharacterized protein LOC118193667 n=1 Tax=Stegodyphus dumicola TaxID=202533 RepID=UPI0015B06602|nr:uncharacterized protein LOC118193667 [Stegodyphus dumicola]